ncbi:UBP-type zinc finger domain-containing protein [Nocardia sp. NPDC050193]
MLLTTRVGDRHTAAIPDGGHAVMYGFADSEGLQRITREIYALSDRYPQCLAVGSHPVPLRLGVDCGHVGCFDSSPFSHATAHRMDAGHAVMRTSESGEGWRWQTAARTDASAQCRSR